MSDLVERAFKADRPNKFWVADITYVPTWVGVMFLTINIDVWSRKVVGWSGATDLKINVVIAAFNMAVQQRQPEDVINYMDRGCQ